MALQGTLDTFALPDVLRLLAGTKKTGRLRVTGDRGSGSIWVESGQLTATELLVAGSHPSGSAAVLFQLLRFKRGSFVFDTGSLAPSSNPPLEIESILVEAEVMLDEWCQLELVVPSTDAHLTLRPELSGSGVMVDPGRWRVIASIGGGSTTDGVCQTLDIDELDALRVVKDLVELGLVAVSAPVPAAAKAPEVSPLSEPPLAPFGSLPEEPRSRLDADFAEARFDAPPPPSMMDSRFDAPPPPMMDARFDAPPPSMMESRFDAPPPSMMDSRFDAPPPPPPSMMDSRFDAPPPTPRFEPPMMETRFEPPLRDRYDNAPFSGPTHSVADSGPPPTSAELAGLGHMGLSDERSPFEVPLDVTPPPVMSRHAEANLDDPAEIARQLANLSPRAAKAVAAAAKAQTPEEREAALAAIEAEDETVNRGLLLRFLGSVDG